MQFLRVRDKATGHEYDIAETAFDEAAHSKVNAPRAYPPLTSTGARRVTARSAKHRTEKAGESTADSGTNQNEETGR